MGKADYVKWKPHMDHSMKKKHSRKRGLFFTQGMVEKDMKNICEKFENISLKTYDAAACLFQKFLYRWESFCKAQHPLFSITYITPRVREKIEQASN